MKTKENEIEMIQIDKESISRPLRSSLQPGHSTCQYFEHLILSALLNRP